MSNSSNCTGGKTSCWKYQKSSIDESGIHSSKSHDSKVPWRNIKNLAFTNPTYTAASHFSGITKSYQKSSIDKSGIHCGKFTLLELPNPAVSHLAITLAAKHLGENTKNPALTTQHSQLQVTLPEFLNPALPNSINCTGGKTPWWKYQKSSIHIMTYIRQHRHS